MSQSNRERQKQKRQEVARERAAKSSEIRTRRRISVSKLIKMADQMSGRLAELFAEQRRLFVEKFGREPTEDDSLLFSHDSGDPIRLDSSRVSDNTINIFELVGMNPDVIYAMRKTGMLVNEKSKHFCSEEELDEWRAAIAEYHHRYTVAESMSDNDDWLRVLKE